MQSETLYSYLDYTYPLIFYTYSRNPCSSVSTVTKLLAGRLGGRYAQRFLSFPPLQQWPWGPTDLISKGHLGLFHVGKAAGT